MSRIAFRLLIATPLLLVAACTQPQTNLSPKDIDGSVVCTEDGMALLSFDGPKSQIVGKGGERRFFCDFRETVELLLSPVERARTVAIYVQDFGGIPWGSYPGRWISAESAFFVIDSNRDGAMGVSYVPFARIADAQAFQREHGGKLVRLDEITPEVYRASMELQRERLKSMGQ